VVEAAAVVVEEETKEVEPKHILDLEYDMLENDPIPSVEVIPALTTLRKEWLVRISHPEGVYKDGIFDV
jgi:ubiquitin-protein ligase